MSSILELREQRIAQYKTSNQVSSDFPVGTYVEVITPAADFYFFYNERGTVVKNDGSYLGIIVEFDKKYDRPNFNFKPEHLLILGDKITVRTPNTLLERSK